MKKIIIAIMLMCLLSLFGCANTQDENTEFIGENNNVGSKLFASATPSTSAFASHRFLRVNAYAFRTVGLSPL